MPLAACTAVLALFSKDCLGIEKNSGSTVLIWGGSCKTLLSPIRTNMLMLEQQVSGSTPSRLPDTLA